MKNYSEIAIDSQQTQFLKYFSNIHGNTRKSIAEVGQILHKNDWLDKIDLLIRKMSELQVTPELFLSNIQTIKSYINSRDFQNVGRYEKISLFWGGIHYIKSSEKFTVLNKKIDELLNISVKQISKVANYKKNWWLDSLQTVVKYLNNFSVKSLVLTGSQIFLSRALAYSSTGMCLNSFDHPLSGVNSIKYNLNLTELDEKFITFGNVPIERAEFVLFGETHQHNDHIDLQKKYLPLFLKRDDYLLLEGKPSLIETPCIRPSFKDGQHLILNGKFICLGWDLTNTHKEESQKLEKKYSPLFAEKFMLTNKVLSRNLKRLNKLKKYNINNNNFNLLSDEDEKKLKELIVFDQVKLHGAQIRKLFFFRLLNIFLYWRPSNSSLSNKIYEVYCELFGKKNIDSFRIEIDKKIPGTRDLIGSNKSMIRSLKKLKCKSMYDKCSRKLVITGAGHLFEYPRDLPYRKEGSGEEYVCFPDYPNITSSKQIRELLFSNIENYTSNEQVSELRDFLEKEKYVLLYPSTFKFEHSSSTPCHGNVRLSTSKK